MRRDLPPLVRIIRMRAAELGVSQADLAAAAGVSIFRMSRLLTGVQPFRPEETQAIADALDLPQIVDAKGVAS